MIVHFRHKHIIFIPVMNSSMDGPELLDGEGRDQRVFDQDLE